MSFINSVAKSMNGIKTIETSELIFTDDNSSLNTSAGITQAQQTGQTALNKSISAVGFNTSSGVLTLTTQGSGVADLTQNLDGRYLTSGNVVTTDTTQNISGAKTFTTQPKATGTINTDTHLITRGYADGEYVKDTGTQTIAGEKTFSTQPKATGTINTDTHLITRGYADGEYVKDTGTQTIAGEKTFSTQPKATGTINADTHLITRGFANGEYVKDTGNQTIDGIKTFSSFPIKSGTGTALNPTADNQLATKKYVDENAGGGSGDAVLSAGSSGSEQTFTGFNKFNNVINAPAVPTSSNHVTNKNYVDLIKEQTGYDIASGSGFSYVVSRGNPSLVGNSQGNTFGGRMSNSLNADIQIPTGHDGEILVSFCVSGEWSGAPYNNGVILGRATKQSNGSYIYDKLIRAPAPNTSAGLFISNFMISFQGDDNSTIEHATGIIVDDTISAGNTYRYTPILVNSNGGSGVLTFKLNRTINSGANLGLERTLSTINASLVNNSPN